MRLPLSLISDFIDLSSNFEETLTLLGIEVDSLDPKKAPFSGVVVVEIKKVIPHPTAGKLQIAEVTDGKETLQIVCGAANCRPGILVPLAKIGAHLTGSGGTPLHIRKGEFKGIESMGMLCSAAELSLYDDTDGLLELPAEFPLGADCAKLLWDPVAELSFTPNLGHCMSALGVARELSAGWKKPLKKRAIPGKPLDFATIEIRGVRVGPSPFWLQKTLRSAGFRSINNVVDITNYFLIKTGQPMHAYDRNLIEGDALKVTTCRVPFKFHGLDGLEHEVPAGTLLIEDAKKAVALAGIMGGANSAVSERTTDLILEVAAFDPLQIRIASKKIGLRSESSARFERGVDKGMISSLLKEAAELICELAGGKAGTIRETPSSSSTKRTIALRPEQVSKILGVPLSQSEIEELLGRLEIRVLSKDSVWEVSIPSYRNDLQEEIDLIEEVGRLYGYNNLPRITPRSVTSSIPHDPEYLFEKELRSRLIGLGLQEFLNCDLISPKLAEMAQELSHSKRVLLQALYAKTEEYSILRTSLLPGLLQTARSNFDQKNYTLAGFELGRIHFKEQGKAIEIPMMALLLSGEKTPSHWDQNKRDFDFFDLKGMVENLLYSLRIPEATIHSSSHPTFHPGRQAEIHLGNEIIGTLGELHPALLSKFDLKHKVYYAEIRADALKKHLPPAVKMTPLPLFPSSERDWTIPLPERSHVGPLLDQMKQIPLPLLESIQLISLYQKETQTQATFRFSYRDKTKTLSFEEVEAAHAHLVAQVSTTLSHR